MKQFLHSSAFTLLFLLPFLNFSQIYKIDEKKIYEDIASVLTQTVKEIYTYDNDGNKETNLLGLDYPSLTNNYQFNKTYNVNNDIVLSVRQDWNGSSWDDDLQEVYTYYTGTSKLKDVTTYSFGLGHDISKTLYEYSGNDIIKYTIQIWGSSSLVNYLQFEYTYSSGLPATEIQSEWDGANWQPTEKTISTHSGGLLILLEVYAYDSGDWDTEPFDRYITEYSGTLPTVYRWETWNGSSWDFNDRELSTYDTNDNKIEYAEEIWSGSWEPPYYKEEISYSVATPFSLGVESFDTSNFKIYPNPTSGNLNISSIATINKIEIFNVLGKQVLASAFTKQLNLEGFKSGVYLLRVYSDRGNAIKRVIIKY